ncbi:hypothetical protein LINPERPRIM_LOCUS22248 [Linum perenne]
MIWPINSKTQKNHANSVLIYKMVHYGYHPGRSLSNQNSKFFFGVCFIG